MKKEERIFTILNKLNRVWMGSKGKLEFCEIVKLLSPNLDLSDLEFSKAMDEYIELNKIK